MQPYQHPSTTFVWRNHLTWGYKIGQAYTSQPLDLSNYLLIRTRERLLFENKVHAPNRVMRSGKASKLTSKFAEQSLIHITEDLTKTLPQFTNMLYVLQPTDDHKVPDLPVAFATNALYILERNGGTQREVYDQLLLPVLRAKAEHLHAEGVAQAVWALANAELTDDAKLWSTLKEHVLTKDFAPSFIKNERWSGTLFSTLSGSEHFFESELSEFADQLFYKDQINLYEVYNGLLKAHSLNKSLGLDVAIKHLEQVHGDAVLRKND